MSSLHIIGSRQLGGADQFFIRLVQALNDAGHAARALVRPRSPISATLSAAGSAYDCAPLANQWDVFSIWRIRQLVAAGHYDIVQTYMGRATRLTRLPKTSPAVHIARLGGYYQIDGYYRHADAWVGNTHGVCDYLVRNGLPASRVFYIGNFAPEPQWVEPDELAALRRQWSVPEDGRVIFALGRLIDSKGFADLLRAFVLLPATWAGRPLYLLIAGDGPLRNSLRALTQQLGVQVRVRWLGWQAQPGPFFQLADVACCPSRQEPLGNVILEAWSYAKAVVATATAGATELIRDNDNGLLAPIADPPLLAARLHEALTAPEHERARLAQAGQRDLACDHGRAAVVEKYLDLYRLLGHSKR